MTSFDMDRFLPITISLMIILLGAIVGVIGYSLWASDQMSSENKQEIVRDCLCIIFTGLFALLVSIFI